MIYFDNSATTPIAPEVKNIINETLDNFGNPSSRHAQGLSAEHLVKDARSAIAKAMGVSVDEIYFTSGGTESDNIAILGGANIKKGKRVVTTAIEHHAVLHTMDALEARGFEIVRVAPQKDGSVKIDDILDAIDEKTCLVSVMHVNNETGAILPIDRIKEHLSRVAPRALLHTDAVQSFGHIEFRPKEWGIDLASVSGHKIHATKGIGALYIRKGATIHSPIYGGGQEKGIRSGTENTLGIAALAVAAELIDLKDGERVKKIKEKILAESLKIPDCIYNGGSESESPYILNISFGGIRSETLLNALSASGIYVSSGSACAANRPQTSHVLKAMGAEMADNAIRFSFSRYNTMEEADRAIAVLRKTVEEFRAGFGR